MAQNTFKTPLILTYLAFAAILSGCDGDGGTAPVIVVPDTPAPPPTPTPSPTPTGFNVGPCLNQVIPVPGSPTVASAVVPDTLTINLANAAGFPNGRRLSDPVIDITLAVIFLDLTTHSPLLFANLPLNPPTNDRPFRSTFPYLAVPQGTPPLSGTTGTNFTFNNAPSSDFDRVDRTGMPAISPALIGPPLKNGYNNADPADDATGRFVPEISAQLTGLTNALADDLVGLGLTPCAVPNT